MRRTHYTHKATHGRAQGLALLALALALLALAAGLATVAPALLGYIWGYVALMPQGLAIALPALACAIFATVACR